MPDDNAQPPNPSADFFNATTLGFIAYVMFPTLAIISTVFGAILLSRDNIAGGIAFFVLLQLWVVGGIVVHLRRRRLLLRHSRNTDDDGRTPPAE